VYLPLCKHVGQHWYHPPNDAIILWPSRGQPDLPCDRSCYCSTAVHLPAAGCQDHSEMLTSTVERLQTRQPSTACADLLSPWQAATAKQLLDPGKPHGPHGAKRTLVGGEQDLGPETWMAIWCRAASLWLLHPPETCGTAAAACHGLRMCTRCHRVQCVRCHGTQPRCPVACLFCQRGSACLLAVLRSAGVHAHVTPPAEHCR
jgi:hypothetical protein